MESWQKKFLAFAAALEEKIDRKKFALKNKLNLIKAPTIQPYHGFACGSHLYLYGQCWKKKALTYLRKGPPFG